jgi:hypothetical protein
MRRLAALAALLVLSACSGDSGSSSRVQGQAPATAAKDEPIFVVKLGRDDAALVRLNARTLRPLPGRLGLGHHGGLWTRSPDGSAVAFDSTRSPTVLIAALRPFGARGEVRLHGEILALAWVAPRRLLAVVQTRCCAPVLRALAIDPVSRRVVASRPLGRRWEISAAARSGTRLVLLLARPASIHASRLVVLDGGARSRGTELPGIRVGARTLGDVDGLPISESRSAGLVVHGRRALVVGAPPPLVADVDLRTLSVRYHRLAATRGRLARLLDWLEPPAHAGGGGYNIGAHRRAVWLDGGLLAVGGYDERIDRTGAAPRQVFDPAGLRIVDTRRWTIRLVEPKATALAGTGDRVVAWGGDGPALVGFGLDGKERFRLVRLPSQPDLQFAWPYAYRGLSGPERQHRVDVIDLRTGALVGRGSGRGMATLLGDHELLCWCW